jgi:carboxypeptidase Taq
MKGIDELMQELLDLLRQASYYGYTANLYIWNREVAMPKGAGPDLDKLYSLMATKSTEMLIAPRIGDVLEELQSRQSELDPNQVRIVQRLAEIYRRAKAVPLGLVQAWTEATSKAHRFWTQAKRESDFRIFLPHLETVLHLAQERARAFGFTDCVYDALVPDFEPGMTTAELQTILLPLRDPLSNLAQRIAQAEPINTACLTGNFPVERQMMTAMAALNWMGLDFERGRLDAVLGHPMTITLGPNDVRLTTRLDPNVFGPGFFAAIHEGGHVLYEQGKDSIFDWIYLDSGVSMAIHESQSRMWENLVARGLQFWNCFWPTLQAIMPSFNQVEFEAFFEAINAVKPGFIRVQADEVTYNLHILLRFELELALLNNDLAPADLPGAWNDKMQEYLGITPPNDAQGCLQDIHWSQGYFGYFPTYALGNLMAAQLWNTIKREMPTLEDDLAMGNFATLLDWLRINVHAQGPAYTLREMAEETTGEGLGANHWLQYIAAKYSAIYEL